MKTFNTTVSEIFKIPVETVHDDMSPKDIPQWDSMNYLFFIAELEKEFDVQLGMNEIMNAKCLGDLRKAVASHGKIV